MPLYEFACSQCESLSEHILKIHEAPPACEKCGGALVKKLSAPYFKLMGQGWYETDFKSKGKKEPRSSSSGEKQEATGCTKASCSTPPTSEKTPPSTTSGT